MFSLYLFFLQVGEATLIPLGVRTDPGFLRGKRGVLSWYDEKRMQCNIAISECKEMLASALLSACNIDKVNIAILRELFDGAKCRHKW